MSLSRVVILNDASRALGGATGLAMLSARKLRERGLDVVYVCGDDGDAPDLTAMGVEVVAAGGAKLLQKSRSRALRDGIHNPAMRDFVAGTVARFDRPGTVFHLHGWAQILSPAVFDALRPVAARTLIHAHDMFLACPNGVYMDYRHDEVCTRVPLSASCLATQCDKRSYPQKLWRVARTANMRRLFRPGDGWGGIVQIHPAMTERLTRAGYPEGLIRTLRNPARPWSDTRIAAEDNAALLYVGRLEADKGPLRLLQAARRTGQSVICVGDGVQRARIARDFPDVEVTGWLDRDGIAAHAARARALVMPSLHPEPFALVLAEASQSGLPVLTARTALMAPEIAAKRLGLSFDVFDPASIEGALAAIRDMPRDGIRAMSDAGHAAKDPLSTSPDAWIDGLVALYDQLTIG